MPLTQAEWILREQNIARRKESITRKQTEAKTNGVSPALLSALETSRPTLSTPEQLSISLVKTSSIIFKSLASFVTLASMTSTSSLQNHGVPTRLFRLPLEIREQIYGYVLGYKTIFEITEIYDKTSPSGKKGKNVTRALLQTCRQVYSEAISSVYTSNTFTFQNHNAFLKFAHTINPILLNRIPSISFTLNSLLHVDGTPYDHQCPRFTVWWKTSTVQTEWSHLWIIIAAMENLTELNVYIEDPGYPEWEGMQCLCTIEYEILQPLFMVKRELRAFEVDVPWVIVGSRKTGRVVLDGARFGFNRRWREMMRYN